MSEAVCLLLFCLFIVTMPKRKNSTPTSGATSSVKRTSDLSSVALHDKMTDLFKDMEQLEKQYHLSLSGAPSLALSRARRATPSVYAAAT